MSKFEERLKENHKIKTRCMLWYVRDSLLLEKVREEFNRLLHSVDNWKIRMSEEDIVIADMLIKSGVDLDTIVEYQEKCVEESKHHERQVI